MINLDISTIAADLSSDRTGDIEKIHRRCGIYTKPDVVSGILDGVGWTPANDLLSYRLLEPAAGDGRFVVEAANRLVDRARRIGVKPTLASFRDLILAYEFHEATARRARANVASALRVGGVHGATAAALAREWIRIGDFLLAQQPVEPFTHVVGNPPYIRWCKIPPALRAIYGAMMPRAMVGGDLFVPFLDRSLEWLVLGGQCGFLCSDRWRYMAFGRGFRDKWLPRLDVGSEVRVEADDAFVRAAGAYPTILIARKRTFYEALSSPAVHLAPSTLAQAGYIVRVGPALGCTPAFVVSPGEDDVEAEALRPWIGPKEVSEGSVAWLGSRVAIMHRPDGKLVDLADFPLLGRRLDRHRAALSRRAIVKQGAPWYRSIDRVRAADWNRPKLLVPELSKVPRIALDLSGAVPSHGVYAIFSPDDDLSELLLLLSDGGLARALETISPKVSGGYVRCYRRFLDAIPIVRRSQMGDQR